MARTQHYTAWPIKLHALRLSFGSGFPIARILSYPLLIYASDRVKLSGLETKSIGMGAANELAIDLSRGGWTRSILIYAQQTISTLD